MQEKQLTSGVSNRLDKAIDRIMTREFVAEHSFERAIAAILFSDAFIFAVENADVGAVVSRDASGKILDIACPVNLRQIVARRVRHNLQPSVARWR